MTHLERSSRTEGDSSHASILDRVEDGIPNGTAEKVGALREKCRDNYRMRCHFYFGFSMSNADAWVNGSTTLPHYACISRATLP